MTDYSPSIRDSEMIRAKGDKVRVFDTLARGVDVYRRYLLVAAVLVCAAIIGGLIQRRLRRL
jgi:hypothetical protein